MYKTSRVDYHKQRYHHSIDKNNITPCSRTIALYCMGYGGILEPGWNTQAGSFTFRTFNFVLWRVFARSARKKKSTPEDNSWQIAVKRSYRSTSRGFFSLFFLVFLPLPVLVFGWFFRVVQWSWTWSRRGWVFGAGLVSAFTFTVWLCAAYSSRH